MGNKKRKQSFVHSQHPPRIGSLAGQSKAAKVKWWQKRFGKDKKKEGP